MKKTHTKIKPIINYSEIGRRLGITPQYVGQLLDPKNKRKNPERIKSIRDLVHNELQNFKHGKAA
jgi:hypothetical protein